MGTDRDVRQLARIAAGVAEDLAVAAMVLQFDQDQAKRRDDLFSIACFQWVGVCRWWVG